MPKKKYIGIIKLDIPVNGILRKIKIDCVSC
jgi:hypothetical protein